MPLARVLCYTSSREVLQMAEGDVGRLIIQYRERLGMMQKELARAAGVGRSWLSLVELGRRKKPERERLELVANALGVEPAILLAAAGYRVVPLPLRGRRTLGEIVAELEAASREAPILIPEATSAVSAGPGTIGEPDLWPYWPLAGERGHEFTVVRVIGTCLEPRIREGERVVVDKTASPRPGDIVAAEHDGERIVKVLERRNGDLWLTALQGQPPIRVDGQTRIIGVVRMVMHRP